MCVSDEAIYQYCKIASLSLAMTIILFYSLKMNMQTGQDKTILMSLSSQAVFRNLFFFPESFFDRLHAFLEKEKDWRVVILVPDRTLDKYLPLLKDRLHDRLFLEPVRPLPKKNKMQLAFTFFYSYLIYTDTTKLMATMGARPDEPPAGGNWFLAPVKWTIARTFGTLPFIKTRVIPFLYFRIFRTRPFKNFFDIYKPVRVFVPHIYGWFDTELIAEAKRQGVQTIGMPAGWDHVDKYFLPLHVDTLLVASEQIAAHANEFQAYDRKDMQMVGYPHFDFIVNPAFIRSRKETLSSLTFPQTTKYILYVSGSAYCPDEPDVIETILKWMDEGRFGADARLVIRPYLGGRSKDKEFDEEKFNRFEAHPRVIFYRPDFWGDIDESIHFINIMRYADIVLAVFTTMALEASVVDRPLAAVAFDGYHKRPFGRSIRRFERFTHFADVRKTGAMKTAHNFDELYAILDHFFKDPSWGSEERKLLREKLCYKLDGRASVRIMEHVFKR